MGYFANNRTVNLDILRKSGIYSDALLDEMKNGNYKALLELLTDTDRRDRDFMEPLLYSVKHENDTYAVYKYYGENLKEDVELARDIVKQEPELIVDAPVSNNRQFILEMAEINPEVVRYMSQNLKSDSTFTEELCELNDKEVTMYAAKECKMPDIIKENPNLAENKEFMIEAVKEDANTLEYASEDLKNDYEFIKEVCINNKESIDYVSEHTEEFGEKGLSATKDALVEVSSDEAISGFEEEQKKIREQIEGKSEDNAELEGVLRREKQLERHIKLFERIKNGEIDPVRAAKLMDKLCKNLDDKYREEIKQLLKIDEAIIEKQKESKDKQVNKENIVKVELEDVEKITEGATLEGLKEETKVIRQEKEKETKTNQIGENTDDRSND